MGDHDDFERSIAFAEAALRQLRRHRLPVHSRTFELWFSYATGDHPLLNAAIDEHVEAYQSLSIEAAFAFYNQHLSPERIGVRLEQVGGQVAGEIDGIDRLLSVALSSADGFGATLKAATDELRRSSQGGPVEEVVARLAASTQNAERHSETLREQLAHARREMQSLHRSLEAIRSESLTDPLTGLANRKFFDQMLRRAVDGVDPTPLSLILADVDHFKGFNDTHGHQTGDQVLRLVAQTMKRTLGGSFVACRYGGEEFGIILPNTELPDALVVAEHVRDAIAGRSLIKRSTGENLGRVTVSLGVSAFRAGDSAQTLVERADAALYLSKESGRNQTSAQSLVPPVRRAASA